MQTPTLLIAGHGSRNRQANMEFETLVSMYGSRWPDFKTTYGYLEHATPSLDDALKEAAQNSDLVVLLPLFLFAAGHIKLDIPQAVERAQERFPRVQFAVASGIGPHPGMAELALARARTITTEAHLRQEGAAVVVVGRGFSDAQAYADFLSLVHGIGERYQLAWIEPSCVAISAPLVEETIESVIRRGAERVIVLPYFLFAGRLISKLQHQLAGLSARHQQVDILLAPHLGVHPILFTVVDERLREALGQLAGTITRLAE